MCIALNPIPEYSTHTDMSPDCKFLAHAWLHLQPLSMEGNRKLGWDLVLYSNFLWPQSYRYAEWRDLYRATPALTQALGFCRVIQMTMTFYCVFTTSEAYRELILTQQSLGFDDMLTYFLKSFLSWPCDIMCQIGPSTPYQFDVCFKWFRWHWTDGLF